MAVTVMMSQKSIGAPLASPGSRAARKAALVATMALLAGVIPHAQRSADAQERSSRDVTSSSRKASDRDNSTAERKGRPQRTVGARRGGWIAEPRHPKKHEHPICEGGV